MLSLWKVAQSWSMTAVCPSFKSFIFSSYRNTHFPHLDLAFSEISVLFGQSLEKYNFFVARKTKQTPNLKTGKHHSQTESYNDWMLNQL